MKMSATNRSSRGDEALTSFVPAARKIRASSRRLLQSGFSLLEVMVAMLILGLSLTGLVHGINTALASNKEAEIQTLAAMLAAGQIEEYRADGFVVEGEMEGEFDGDLSIYSWRRNIVATQPEGLFEMTVTIEKTASGEELYELKTMLFDPPVTRELDEKEKKDRDKKRGRL
jgi:prepilin-type N-terminal cleavage/methylation domain-containing protein